MKNLSEETKLKISNSLKGIKRPPISDEHRNNLRLSHLGKKLSQETKNKMSLKSKGRFHSEKSKLKMSLSKIGKKRLPFSDESIKKMSLAKKGKNMTGIYSKCSICLLEIYIPKSLIGRKQYCSINCRAISSKGRKLSQEHILKVTSKLIGRKRPDMANRTGENHPNWIKDRTKLVKRQMRNDMAYKNWRSEVYKRDKWKCKINNKDCCGKIEAHHILCWRDFVELRYEVNNGITLCHFHHPLKKEEEKRLVPTFQELVLMSVSEL